MSHIQDTYVLMIRYEQGRDPCAEIMSGLQRLIFTKDLPSFFYNYLKFTILIYNLQTLIKKCFFLIFVIAKTFIVLSSQGVSKMVVEISKSVLSEVAKCRLFEIFFYLKSFGFIYLFLEHYPEFKIISLMTYEGDIVFVLFARF